MAQRWSRCKIEKFNLDDDTVAVWFLDYGGFYEFHRADVKRIDNSFLKVPFQARLVQIVNLDETPSIENITNNTTEQTLDEVKNLLKGEENIEKEEDEVEKDTQVEEEPVEEKTPEKMSQEEIELAEMQQNSEMYSSLNDLHQLQEYNEIFAEVIKEVNNHPGQLQKSWSPFQWIRLFRYENKQKIYLEYRPELMCTEPVDYVSII